MEKIILLGLVLCLMLVSGCSEKTVLDENLKTSIEMNVDRSDVYEGVKTGMTKEEVSSKFGEPTKKQQIESDASQMVEGLENLDINTKMKMEFWYYGNVQIAFTNGKVSSKMQY